MRGRMLRTGSTLCNREIFQNDDGPFAHLEVQIGGRRSQCAPAYPALHDFLLLVFRSDSQSLASGRYAVTTLTWSASISIANRTWNAPPPWAAHPRSEEGRVGEEGRSRGAA